MKCFIFDLDGTIADDEHRRHHVTQKSDWDAYYSACPDDKPIWHVLHVLHALQQLYKIIIVTGRSEGIRRETEAWLIAHSVLFWELHMRKKGDRRKNSEYKTSIVADLRRRGYEILMAFEDLKPAVRTYRALGVPCAQVAETPVWEIRHP